MSNWRICRKMSSAAKVADLQTSWLKQKLYSPRSVSLTLCNFARGGPVFKQNKAYVKVVIGIRYVFSLYSLHY